MTISEEYFLFAFHLCSSRMYCNFTCCVIYLFICLFSYLFICLRGRGVFNFFVHTLDSCAVAIFIITFNNGMCFRRHTTKDRRKHNGKLVKKLAKAVFMDRFGVVMTYCDNSSNRINAKEKLFFVKVAVLLQVTSWRDALFLGKQNPSFTPTLRSL